MHAAVGRKGAVPWWVASVKEKLYLHLTGNDAGYSPAHVFVTGSRKPLPHWQASATGVPLAWFFSANILEVGGQVTTASVTSDVSPLQEGFGASVVVLEASRLEYPLQMTYGSRDDDVRGKERSALRVLCSRVNGGQGIHGLAVLLRRRLRIQEDIRIAPPSCT